MCCLDLCWRGIFLFLRCESLLRRSENEAQDRARHRVSSQASVGGIEKSAACDGHMAGENIRLIQIYINIGLALLISCDVLIFMWSASPPVRNVFHSLPHLLFILPESRLGPQVNSDQSRDNVSFRVAVSGVL